MHIYRNSEQKTFGVGGTVNILQKKHRFHLQCRGTGTSRFQVFASPCITVNFLCVFKFEKEPR